MPFGLEAWPLKAIGLGIATASSYSVDNWLLADGDDRDVTAASDAGAFR
jgi:hypothetical protein